MRVHVVFYIFVNVMAQITPKVRSILPRTYIKIAHARSATMTVFKYILRTGCPAFRAIQVGAELLYIAQAPKLALNDNDFVEFPDVSRITEPYDRKV